MSTLVRGLNSRVTTPKVQEIDLATGKPKPRNPLKDANDYSKWEVLNVRMLSRIYQLDATTNGPPPV